MGTVAVAGVCRGRAGRFMVTNERFGEFVGNTSYKTDSEKYGWSFVFLPMLSKRQQREIQQVRPYPVGGLPGGMASERQCMRKFLCAFLFCSSFFPSVYRCNLFR